jgi:hypothetical protein
MKTVKTSLSIQVQISHDTYVYLYICVCARTVCDPLCVLKLHPCLQPHTHTPIKAYIVEGVFFITKIMEGMFSIRGFRNHSFKELCLLEYNAM